MRARRYGITKKRHVAHCERRAFERYGELHADKLIPEILSKIRKGDGEFVRKQSNSKTLWKVIVNLKTYIVVYDKNTKCLVTFLPLDETDNCENSNTQEADLRRKTVVTNKIDFTDMTRMF
jgi:hypothetical protein